MDKSPNCLLTDKLESYYRIPTNKDNDFCVTDYPIVINCTGYSQYNCTVCGDSLRKDFYCIYLTHGQIKIDSPLQKTMYAGDMVIFSPNTAYQYTGLKPFSYHWVHFSGSCAKQFLLSCNLKLNNVMHPGISEEILTAMQKIKIAFKNRELFWDTTAAAELLKLFTAAGKTINSKDKKKKEITEMEKAAAYIQSHISSSLSVAKLAEMHHMSVSGFRSKFKAYSGMSPQEYINTVRLREAARLLTTTDTSIENIATICGYNDAMYFSRYFRSKTGQSPSKYRKNMK